MSSTRSTRKGTQLLIGLAVAIGGLIVGYCGGTLGPSSMGRKVARSPPWEPGDQLVLVVYGSSSCRWCTDERMPELLSEFIAAWASHADEQVCH